MKFDSDAMFNDPIRLATVKRPVGRGKARPEDAGFVRNIKATAPDSGRVRKQRAGPGYITKKGGC
jgi:hypothetical protein